jgi:hypothetical protein
MTAAIRSKNILLKTTGVEEPVEIPVELMPESSVADVLEQTGLRGYRLTDPGGGSFKPGERLFDKVGEGEKVFAVKVDDLSAG